MENHKGKILVVDDEAAVRRILKTRLTMVGYDVLTAADGDEALEVFASALPDLVVLDVMMPRKDGYEVCQEMRKYSDIPIILLTALGDVSDRITGLQFGADDYLVKPFSPKELEARISSILRRFFKKNTLNSNLPNSGVLEVGTLYVDANKRRVYLGNELVRLTEIEFNLLQLLVENSGEPVSRPDILKKIWGYSPQARADLRVVDVHISRLRGKIEEDPRNPEFIITERGTGYSFQRLVSLPQAAGA
ncbi:MAG: response regulator transcription factor [Oscillatoria sp. PMC 1068.18]|nr:response regulator transcription factor [Oscillatoria sp. PMC 1076.18]MEC4990701.1 response regulator transcription factor [Oscillatoria sp. PMC 1068.18]